jgi:hypothetical protein
VSSPLRARNSSDSEQSWSYASQKELLELWVGGMDLELLALHLNRKQLDKSVLAAFGLKAAAPDEEILSD